MTILPDQRSASAAATLHHQHSQVTSGAWLGRYAQACLGVFAPARTLVRGEGCYVWDADGKRYLDLMAGIAVNALGHAHPVWVQAIAEQAGRLGHISNLFASDVQIELAEMLQRLFDTREGRVFLCNSGAEAIEAAVKLSLRTGRRRMVAMEGSFHGRTLGALALTSKAAYREPFGPLSPQVQFVPFGDVEALASSVDESVGGIVVEVVQGEGGVNPLPDGYLEQARLLADDSGALLVVDEIQTGIGRTGTWFAFRNPALVSTPVLPDVVTLAKGLGGGFPIGAMVALTERAAGILQPGDHGTTFGGNPLAAAAALATLRTIEADGLAAQAASVMDGVAAGAEQLAHPLISGTRGAGALRAIVLNRPIAAKVAKTALDAGFIIGAVTPTALRLAPPLTLTAKQGETFIQALGDILDTAAAGVPETPDEGNSK
ncbi:MAG: acetylornithine transaminase [Bifidobacteriaceae bacterium]|jgi:acetylornithine aminotransferase|nr:acetylornithine transaminase [Bifidobacteriaceae bacterium]